MTTDTTKPVTLALDFGHGHDWREPLTCPLCGDKFCPERPRFNMAVLNGPVVCDHCAERHSPPGAWDACESFLRGLEDIDNALFYAPARFRAGLLSNVLGAVKWLAEYYEAVEAAERAEKLEVIPGGKA